MEENVNKTEVFDPTSYIQDKVNEEPTDGFDPSSFIQNKLNEDDDKTLLTNKVATVTEPDSTFVDTAYTFLKAYAYHKVDEVVGSEAGEKLTDIKEFYSDTVPNIYGNLFKGSQKGLLNTASFLADVTGAVDTKAWIDDVNKDLDGIIQTTDTVGNIAETVGQVGTGLFLTRGMSQATWTSRLGQGFLIDLLAFDSKSGNIADVFDQYDINLGGIVDIFKSDASDGEKEGRFKNAFANTLGGGALELVAGGFRLANNLLKSGNIELQGTDAEVMQTVMNTLKQEADTIKSPKVDNMIQPEQVNITKAQFNEGSILYNRAIEMIKDVPENFDELVSKSSKVVTDSKQVDATLNLKQPLNAEKITPSNAETLAKATQDIEADAEFISHKDLLTKADKDLQEKLGDENYQLIKDLTNTAESVDTLSLKVTQARLVVGNLAQKFQDSILVAQKEGSAESMMRSMLALDNLVMTSKILKNTTSSVAKAMSAMRINTEESQLFNSLKIMDNIDTDYSMSVLREAMAKGDAEGAMKIMDNFSDTTTKLKDHIDNYTDNLFKKVGNVLSEGVVASMLSAPSTLAVNIIGNTFVKHQRFLQDAMQFVFGKVLRNSDAMRQREFKYLMHSQVLSTFKDLSSTGKLIKDWAKSGFKDETFDEAVLARYVQDQQFQHKYISSQYIRGMEKGNANSTFNNMINVFGRLARSPYKLIGAVDDYYKRNSFRSELVRTGSRLADKLNIPDAEYNKFMDRFIKANTELHILRNNGHKPTSTFIKANKQYLGNKDTEGLFKYADEARDHANYMTFQTELTGIVGKGVDFLNSDGFLRILVPFKLTPINMLKMSVSTAMTPLKTQIYKDIATGGLKRDIALAKLSYSATVLTSIGALVSSGHMTGTFKKEEREAMASAGIPELSYKVGNTWYDYRQLEPLATIAGVMTDLYRLQHDTWLRKDEILADENFSNLPDEVGSILADTGLSIVNNIVNKTYAKSLSDTLDLISGNKNLVDYSGNLISSAVPFSSLSNFIGREFGDGYKKEAPEFTEKILSKYRLLLERDALDAYGKPIKEIEYTPFLTKKLEDIKDIEGAKEIARLGINVHKMPKDISFQGVSVKLNPQEYWDMRRNLDTKFKLSETLNNIVKSSAYKDAPDSARAEILSSTMNRVKLLATRDAIQNTRVISEVKKGIEKKIKDASSSEPKRTYNDMILGEGNE